MHQLPNTCPSPCSARRARSPRRSSTISAESDEVQAMTLLDLDGERADGGRRRPRRPARPARSAVDARAVDELAGRSDGVDVLVNTASYRINLDAMRACLTAGCTLPRPRRPLLDDAAASSSSASEFERAGLLALLGIGSSPGKTNLMARAGVRELGADAGPIERSTSSPRGRDPGAPADDRLRPPYAIQTLLDELTLAPVVLRGGDATEIEPLTPGGASTSASRSARPRRSTRCTPSSPRSARASAVRPRASASR